MRVWLYTNWKIVVSFITLLFAILFVWSSRRSDVLLKSKKSTEVLKTERDVAKLEGMRDLIKDREGEVSDKIKEVDGKILDLDKKLVADKLELRRLKSKEKLSKFKDYGYK